MLVNDTATTFETKFQADRLREFCEDRVRTLWLRLAFGLLLVLAAFVAHDLQGALVIWFGAACIAQIVEALACRLFTGDLSAPARDGLAKARSKLVPLVTMSAATYAVSVPLALSSDAPVLQMAGAAMGFGSMAAVAWRGASVPNLLWPMMTVYFAALVGGALTATSLQSQLGLAGALVLVAGYSAVLAQTVQMARTSASSVRRLAEAAHIAHQSSEAKGAFLAMASHELRTPMNAIIGSVELMGRDPDTERQEELVGTIRSAARNLVRHLDDILDVARIEAGRIDLDLHPFAPHQLFADLRTLWQARADEKGIGLSITVHPDLPEGLEGDSHRLSQIVSNLVSNALKFTSEGSVAVDVCRIENRLIVSVADTGCGIDPDAAARLFAPFQQARSEEARTHGGSGLGLMIARGLAARMSGSLELASTPGRGTTFTLSLPMAAAQPPALPAPAALAPQAKLADVCADGHGPHQVLVAEDNAANMMILCRLLELAGIEAVRTLNGAEAVEAAQQQLFDAILLDVRMPVMDGLEAARAIRTGGGPNHDAPILMLSADAGKAEQAAGLAAGADLYLTKPIDPVKLFDALARLPELRAGTGEPDARGRTASAA